MYNTNSLNKLNCTTHTHTHIHHNAHQILWGRLGVRETLDGIIEISIQVVIDHTLVCLLDCCVQATCRHATCANHELTCKHSTCDCHTKFQYHQEWVPQKSNREHTVDRRHHNNDKLFETFKVQVAELVKIGNCILLIWLRVKYGPKRALKFNITIRRRGRRKEMQLFITKQECYLHKTLGNLPKSTPYPSKAGGGGTHKHKPWSENWIDHQEKHNSCELKRYGWKYSPERQKRIWWASRHHKESDIQAWTQTNWCDKREEGWSRLTMWMWNTAVWHHVLSLNTEWTHDRNEILTICHAQAWGIQPQENSKSQPPQPIWEVIRLHSSGDLILVSEVSEWSEWVEWVMRLHGSHELDIVIAWVAIKLKTWAWSWNLCSKSKSKFHQHNHDWTK